MPSFSYPSSIRVVSQDHVLRLKITHNLVHGSPSDAVYSLKGRLPKELDVLWLSDIAISLSGSLDGQDMSAHDIARSGIARHLQVQLKANADRLGLNNVSHLFMDDADGLSKMTLTPSRPLPDASRPHANLVSLHLAYIWRRVAGRSDTTDSGHLVEEINPFSPTLFLPAETLLSRATEQFLIYHLVSRYPLVFGAWCKRLDLEVQYFASISRSIVEIMTRSENHKFVSKCKRLIKIARRQHKFVLQTASAALSSCTDDAVPETSEEEMDEHAAATALTDEQVLSASLEQLFRMGVPQRRFKPAARDAPQAVSCIRDDDDGLLQYTPHVGIDDGDSWVELPEIATSPLAYCSQMLPEMDLFAEEDWARGAMWRLHAPDVGLDEREFDEQSDESLIGGPILLASMTTRSAQTVCHQQDADDGEGSGLRYKVSKLAYGADTEDSAVFAELMHSPSHERHDPYCSEEYEQVMGYTGTCQEGVESGSDCDEVNSDSILLELDVPEDAELAGVEEALV